MKTFCGIAAGGVAAPVLSLIEDVISILLVVIDILFPLMALALGAGLLIYLVRKLSRPPAIVCAIPDKTQESPVSP